ncbi:MAG: hypothetical protein ACRDPX_14400 [Gaiellaceae bacterium]
MRARWIGFGACALLYGFALVLLRGEPKATGDQGVLLSVAARMLDGDELYSEVIENKDPLVFYTYAGALGIGGWRGPFLLDGLWLAIAAVAIALLLRELRAPRVAVVTGFIVYPLALTSAWYLAGLTMLGGLAFVPLVPWAWLRGRYAMAGVFVAVVMLFKLNLAAVAVAPLLALVLLGVPEGSRLRQLLRAAGGLGASLLAAGVVLGVWAGLREYLETIGYNAHYANGLLASDDTLGRMREHFEIVLEFFRQSGRWQLPAAIIMLGVFAGVVVLCWTRLLRSLRPLASVSVATLLLTLLTLALTAYWFHHLQMLAYPATLVAATLVAALAASLGARAGAAGAALCVAFALWSSAKNEDGVDLSRTWNTSPISVGADLLDDARGRYYGNFDKVTYMAFGGNSENAHAVFVEDGFELSCRWFHLYPVSLDRQFDETLDCGQQEAPMLVLVTLGFFDDRSAGETRWGSFVRGARRFLEANYEKVGEAHPGFQVWKRRAQHES